MDLVVRPSDNLHGLVQVPASKSHTMRAAIFATMADGVSVIKNPLASPDADACLLACRQLGARVEEKHDQWIIYATGGTMKTPKRVIDIGNSGICLRFIAGLASHCLDEVRITGDASLRRRPMQPLLDALAQLGVHASSACGDGFAPVVIRGPNHGGNTTVYGEDSQHVSALLMAAVLAQQDTHITVKNPGEKPWVGMTLHWFDMLGLRYENRHFENYTVFGGQKVYAFERVVPADFSSAAFPLAAALLTRRSSLTLAGLMMDDAQGDKGIIPVLTKMGASIVLGKKDAGNDGLMVKSSKLKGATIDVNDFIDAVPILTIVGCMAEGTTRIAGASIARTKESNRLAVMVQELRKMGASIRETDDGLEMQKSVLHGAVVDSHHDHRVALSLAVAGMCAEGTTTIRGAECISKTYGSFVQAMQGVGADVRVSA